MCKLAQKKQLMVLINKLIMIIKLVNEIILKVHIYIIPESVNYLDGSFIFIPTCRKAWQISEINNIILNTGFSFSVLCHIRSVRVKNLIKVD